MRRKVRRSSRSLKESRDLRSLYLSRLNCQRCRTSSRTPEKGKSAKQVEAPNSSLRGRAKRLKYRRKFAIHRIVAATRQNRFLLSFSHFFSFVEPLISAPLFRSWKIWPTACPTCPSTGLLKHTVGCVPRPGISLLCHSPKYPL